MVKALVTGAAGFIGYHVASALHEQGHQVWGYDNFNDYYNVQLKRDRASQLSEKSIPVIRADICDGHTLQTTIEQYGITHLIHLAAQAGVRYSLQKPHTYIHSNMLGFMEILEACRLFPHIQLVYASSSSVYGMNRKIPYVEEDRTDHPESLYGATKKSNEVMAHAYSKLFGIKSIGLRYFTVYGPWGRPDMAYYKFTDAILQGKEIEVYLGDEMERDFTYIDDIVAGTIAALHYVGDEPLFNLGGSCPVRLNHMIALLEEKLGKKAMRKEMPKQAGDVKKTFADVKKSQEVLGYFPKVSLEEGLEQFIRWHQRYHV